MTLAAISQNQHDPNRRQTKLSLQKYFGMKAAARAKVEHPYRVVKRAVWLQQVRFRGLLKNTACRLILSNPHMARRTLQVSRERRIPELEIHLRRGESAMGKIAEINYSD